MQHLIMQSVLLHAKPSPSHWRSTGFSSHFCGLSWGQGWRVRSGSGQNVDLTSHFLTQLQCATSDIWNMMLKIWALFNACRPSALFVLLRFNVQHSPAPQSTFFSGLLSHVLSPMSPDPSLRHHSPASPCGMKSNSSPRRARDTRPFS